MEKIKTEKKKFKGSKKRQIKRMINTFKIGEIYNTFKKN